MRSEEFPPIEPDDMPAPNPAQKPPGHSAAYVIGGLGLVLTVALAAFLVSTKHQTAAPKPEVAYQSENVASPVAVAPSENNAPTEEVATEPQPSPAEQLRDAQAQVESLQTELAAHDAELDNIKHELASRDASDADARDRARVRQASIQKEITGLRDALKSAQDERDSLRDGLKQALAEVDRQMAQNDKLRHTAVAYKQASAENLWAAFTNNAKVRICDRGTYKKRENCDAQVDTWFNAEQQATFTSCVNTSQAIPMLWKADGDAVPAHAQLIDAHDKERSDNWYVVYCDPTLPEAMASKDITDETPQVFVASK